MSKSRLNYFITVLGILLIGTGLCLDKILLHPNNFLLALTYVCIGIGCGVFGHGMGNIISIKTMKNYPEIKRQVNIDKNDERNIAIMCHAKAKAYDMMTFVFGTLMISFALMDISLTAILLFVAAYLFVQIYAVYCQNRYSKEM